MLERYAGYAKVFPAYAGMNRQRRSANRRSDSVPRIRGDEPDLEFEPVSAMPCSPHTRG